MDTPHKADPAIYPKLRERVLRSGFPNVANYSIQTVLMDCSITNGTFSVLAIVDGSASIYLSSGGGFIGGGQKYPAIREAALHAIQLATSLESHFQKTETIDLPARGDIFFYLTTSTGVCRAIATEAKLSTGEDPLTALGAAMQKIVTLYRLTRVRTTTN